MAGSSEAAPVISSPLVPDESVSPFRGELETQWLNWSRDVCRLINTCSTAPPLGHNLCIHLQEKRPLNKICMIFIQVQHVYTFLSVPKDMTVLDIVLGICQISQFSLQDDDTTQMCV